MDPLTLSLAGASIIGLISNFKSERKERSDDEFKDFIYWLDNKRHLQIKQFIEENKDLALGIKSLLNQNHDIVIHKLQEISETLLTFSLQIDGFKEITHAIAPNLEISSQAISILEQIEKSGGSGIIEYESNRGKSFETLETNKSIEIQDSRFLEDDLKQLVTLNFLIPDYSKNSERIFRITRLAVKLLEQIGKKDENLK